MTEGDITCIRISAANLPQRAKKFLSLAGSVRALQSKKLNKRERWEMGEAG